MGNWYRGYLADEEDDEDDDDDLEAISLVKNELTSSKTIHVIAEPRMRFINLGEAPLKNP